MSIDHKEYETAKNAYHFSKLSDREKLRKLSNMVLTIQHVSMTCQMLLKITDQQPTPNKDEEESFISYHLELFHKLFKGIGVDIDKLGVQ